MRVWLSKSLLPELVVVALGTAVWNSEMQKHEIRVLRENQDQWKQLAYWSTGHLQEARRQVEGCERTYPNSDLDAEDQLIRLGRN